MNLRLAGLPLPLQEPPLFDQVILQTYIGFLVKNMNKKSVRGLIGPLDQRYEVSERRLGQILE